MLSSPGQHQTTHTPGPPACRIGTAATNDIFHLPFHPFPIATGLEKKVRCRHESINMDINLQACAMEFLGGVQCAQYWPHPLNPRFNCHGRANWDSDIDFEQSDFRVKLITFL